MNFRLIDELQTKAISVSRCCRVLGVSRSGFYEAKRRSDTPDVCKTAVHVRAAFAASQQTYGSRRMVTELSNRGVTAGRFRVRRLMRQEGLKPVRKRKFIIRLIANIACRSLPMCWIVGSIRQRQTGHMSRISPTCALVQAGCIWQL